MSIVAAYIVPHPPLIVPEVGRGQERRIQKTVDSYHRVAKEIGELKPETVVVITPHSVMYQDYIHISPGAGSSGDLRGFGAYGSGIKVDYDSELVSHIEKLAGEKGLAAGTLGERDKKLDHGAIVPLYFIEQYSDDYKVVRISISGFTLIEHYRFGKCIQEAVKQLNRRTVIVASGDLSHRLKDDGPYDYAEEGPIFDEQVTKAMAEGDFLAFLKFKESFTEAAGECGLRGFVIMAGALDGMTVNSELLSYEGPFGVGYAVAAFHPTGTDEARRIDVLYEEEEKEERERIRAGEDDYVSLARLSLESYVRNRRYIDRPPGLPKELTKQKAGVFVTLKKHDRLRGCIGTISPVEECIADEIIRNAVSAGTGDPRFDPVTEDELDELVYSVDVLSDPEPIDSIDELDVERYGVIVSKGSRRGLLLPNIEGVTTPQQQVEIALKKAGILPRENYKLERFEVVRHK
ncbi:MAG: AmmeMemoRadiSam system protein A [Bacillota bacterium]|jgi:AmmeMemoRadiSam system protein A/AmmeMemoRadiSam system protein B|nr:AmmeMemoRadiSam system protein A [Bacillota bacterium]NLM08131.1 AmmeMemoRadiSam system protein A [Clostridiales Family XIII bacterium]